MEQKSDEYIQYILFYKTMKTQHLMGENVRKLFLRQKKTHINYNDKYMKNIPNMF